VLKGSDTRFGFRLDQAQGGPITFAMVVVDGRLYVKRPGNSTWKTIPMALVTTLLTALRLDLVRESVLLASSVSSGSVGHLDTGFTRKFVVQPAPDQLEELEAITPQGSAEDKFLRTAAGEIDVFLTFPGDKLSRLEVHLSGTDPSNGEKQAIVSTLAVHAAKVGAIEAPAESQQADPSTILT
jgi:hypothetical protein